MIQEKINENQGSEKDYYPLGKGGKDDIQSKSYTIRKFTNDLKKIIGRHTDAAKYAKFSAPGYDIYVSTTEELFIKSESKQESLDILKKIIDDVESHAKKVFASGIDIEKDSTSLVITGNDRYVRQNEMKKIVPGRYKKRRKPGFEMYLSWPFILSNADATTGEILKYDQIHNDKFFVKVELSDKKSVSESNIFVKVSVRLPKKPRDPNGFVPSNETLHFKPGEVK
jgi:hypothetical protein